MQQDKDFCNYHLHEYLNIMPQTLPKYISCLRIIVIESLVLTAEELLTLRWQKTQLSDLLPISITKQMTKVLLR